MRLLIMGPQGVGKGTQAALLSKHFGIPAISTGDIFRYNIRNETELGKRVKAYTDKGELVPDELTNSIVKDRLGQEDAKNGWILDGYPRNVSQVRALDDMRVQGVKTTAAYYQEILRNPEFRSGQFNTSFVEAHPELTEYSIKRNPSHLAIAIATAIAAHAGL